MAGILTLSNRFRLESLRADELGRKLELIAHSAKLGVFERQAGSDRILFDRGMMSIYGLDRPPGHVKVSEWTAMLHPADKGDMLDMLSRLWAGDPNVRQMEFRIRRGDGKTRNIRIHWVTQFNRKGEVARVLGIQEDVTDIRQAELQRQLVEARLERIIANLPGVIVSLDLSDPTRPRPIFVSPQCKDIWGFTPEEFLASDHPLDLLHPPAERADMLTQLTAAAESLTPFTHRFRVSTEDGMERWFETHTCASRLADGSVQTDGIILDVTPEMRAQELLEAQRLVAMRAQKHESIGQLTGGVAHDFNNLLAVIMGNLELLRDGIDAPDLLRMVDTSIGATRRGADLTRNMLAFARKAPLEPEVFDLNRLVEETRSWAGRTLPASIHVETILLADLWQVKADPSSTESALLNLILNARDAMQDGGQLTIETANVRLGAEDALPLAENLEPGRYVMLAVRDTGRGIPENSLAQIFEPFYSTKPPGAGTGLGLSMVEGFTRQSGGAVSVSSEPGLGTTFELYFKAHVGVVDTATPLQPVAGVEPATGQRLLVVEDEPEVLSVLVTTLERAGFTVASAPSGDEALALFETCPEFDLLLTDIVMPGRLQGTDLALELRSRAPDLPVVFLSGYAREVMGQAPGSRPEDIRLTKPVRRADLVEAIRKSLSARNAARTGGQPRDADVR
jgi:PAS domain S-box-containing protein